MSIFRLVIILFLAFSGVVVTAQTLDPTFRAPTPITAANISKIVVQPDGKILVSGNISFYGQQRVNHLIRLHPDSRLDESFSFTRENIGAVEHVALLNSGEIVATCGNSLLKLTVIGEVIREVKFEQSIASLNIQEDDKIVITTSNRWVEGDIGHVYRYHTDLTLDETFNQNNRIDGWIFDADLQENKLIILGSFSKVNTLEKNDLVRFDINGNLDETFDVGSGTPGLVYYIKVAPNNTIVLTGTFVTTFSDVAVSPGLIRLEANGAVDPIISTLDIDFVKTKPIFQNDKIIVAGRIRENFGSSKYLFRLNDDGTIDHTFWQYPIAYTNMSTIVFDKDDNFLFGHSSYQKVEYGLGRLTFYGQLDTTFLPPVGKLGYINRGDYYDGKLVVGGDFIDLGGVHTRNIAMMDTKGTVDPNFQISQDATLSAANNSQASQITIVDHDTILVALGNRLLRINSKAQRDSIFVPNDVQVPNWPKGIYYYAEQFEIAGNKIVTNSPNMINMFNSDGTRDLSFTEYYREVPGGLSPLALQANGIVIDILQNGGKAQIGRLDWNGSVDSTFNTIAEPNAIFSDITALEDDDLLITGNFKQYGGAATRSLVKLHQDGEVDEAITANFLNTAPDYTYLKYNRRFREGYLVSGYSSDHSLSVGFIQSDGTFDTNLKLPEDINAVSREIFPVVASHDTVFLFSTFHFSGNSETSSVMKLVFNDRPVIQGIASDLSTSQNTTLSISLNDLIVEDNNSAYPTDFSFLLMPGEHYTIDGNTIVPNSSFVGTLSVPIVVNDGKYDSDPYLLSVNVGSPESVSVHIQVDSVTSEQAFVQFVFSEPVSGFTLEDVTVSNGILTALTTSDSTTFSATLSAVDDSTVYVSVPKNRVRGLSGQENAASNTVEATFPAIAPDVFRLALTVDSRSSTNAPLTATLYRQQQNRWHLDTTLTFGTPSFSFPALPSGTYTLRLQSSDTSLLTSYLGEALTLFDAHPIALNQDTTVSLTLLNRPTAATIGGDGTATIAGVLRQGSTENGRLLMGEPTAEGEPIPSVAVYLLSEKGAIVAFTMTDANGSFVFEGLAVATYRLRVDYGGLSHDATLNQITVQHAQETVQLLLIAGNILVLDSITRQKQQDQVTALLPGDEPTKLQYYPSPVVDQLTLNGLLTKGGGRIQLLNIIGNIVLDEPITQPKQQLQLSSLPSGVYVLLIHQGNQYSIHRIQKR